MKKTFSSYDGDGRNRDLAFEYDLKESTTPQGSSLNSSQTYCLVFVFSFVCLFNVFILFLIKSKIFVVFQSVLNDN